MFDFVADMACSQMYMEESENLTKPEEYRLYVTNLPIELNEEGIREIFNHYGKIAGLFYRPNATWTFVTYKTYREAEFAVRDLNNKPPLYLKVSFGKEKATHEKREETLQNKKSTELYEHLVQDSVHNNKAHMRTINRGKCMNAFYKEKLLSSVHTDCYTSDDLLYPASTDPYTYDPYDTTDQKNALWTRGTVTVTRDGKRHVSYGRGYTAYEIPNPHPKIEAIINQVHEKRFNGLYEHGEDVLKCKIGKCIRCDKSANMKCEICFSFYCSRECQVLDWPYHKAECQKIPALIKHTGSSSVSSNEENAPTSNLPKFQKTLRRPKLATNTAVHTNVEVTTTKTNNITKLDNDISESIVTENDDTTEMEKISSSNVLEIEKNIKFTNDEFITKKGFIHVKIVNVEDQGIYWVQRCSDKRAIANISSKLMNIVKTMPKVKPIVGNLYIHKWEQNYYRMRVISLNPTKAILIDYGITITVTDDNFHVLKMKYGPPFARKIGLSKNAKKEFGTFDLHDIIVVMAVEFTDDIIIVDVKHKQIGGSSTVSAKSESKVLLSLPSVLDHLSENVSGYLDVQTVLDRNIYGVILVPKDMLSQAKQMLYKLINYCVHSKPVDEKKISMGELVCGKGADCGFYRGCVISLQPIRIAMLDQVKIATPEEMVTYPKELLSVCKFGVVCEVDTQRVKLKVRGSYEFKVLSCTNPIRIEIALEDASTVEAVLKLWEPRPRLNIKLFELKDGLEVCITAYHNPSKLYVRSLQTKDMEKYHKIMQDVAKCAQTAPYLEELPLVGEMVLAQYTDDNFYRAIVTKIEQDGIMISYVDYGNGETVSLEKLKVLPPHLEQYPSCIAKVTLKGVPTDVPINKDVSSYFIDLTGREIPLICNFDGVPSEDGVTLSTANGESINEKVIQLLTPSWKRNNENDKTVYTVKDLIPAKLGDSDETRVIVLRTVHEGVKYVMCPLDLDLITNVYDVLPGLMNEYCETADYYIPRNNELCLGLYDDNWYRALCLDDSLSDKCNLFFLDYGNMEYVLHKNIRAMTKDFLTPATLSNICIVINLAPKDEEGNIEPHVLKRISELINQDDDVLIKIVNVEQEGFYTIELPEIHDKLIEEGLI